MNGRPMVVLPHRGEFGSKVIWHAPVFHGIQGQKIIYIEAGEEALYPSATEHIQCARADDAGRRWFPGRDEEFVREMAADARRRFPGARVGELQESAPKALFRPDPFMAQNVGSVDVVVCPRRRMYGAEKNWPEWIEVTRVLQGHGLSVFGAGVEDSSYNVPCGKAWDFERPLDATIEAMLKAKAVLATDNGLAHLAVLCGAPLVLVTHRDGLVAPGPQVNEAGRHMKDSYDKVKWWRYQRAQDHLKSPVLHADDSWYNPAKAVAATLDMVARRSSPSSAPAASTTPTG